MNPFRAPLRLPDRGALVNFVVLLGLVLALPALSGCTPYCPLDYCLCAVGSWGENWGTSSLSRRVQLSLVPGLAVIPDQRNLYPLKTQRLQVSIRDLDQLGGTASIRWTPPKGTTGYEYSLPPLNPEGPPPYRFETTVPPGNDGVDLFFKYYFPAENQPAPDSADWLEGSMRGSTLGFGAATMLRYGADREGAGAPGLPASAAPLPSSTREAWISELWIFPKGNAGMTTAICQAVVNQMQSGTVFLGVRTPAKPGQGNSGWQGAVVSDESTAGATPVFEIQNRATPGSPLVRLPLVAAPDRIGWLLSNVPDEQGMVWSALQAAPSPAVSCPSGVNLSQNWDFYLRLPLDVADAGPDGCAGCRYQLWFGGEGTSKTLANAVESASRQGVGAAPAAGEATGTVALGPVEVTLGVSEGAGTDGLPLEVYPSGITSLFAPGSIRFPHTLQSRSSSSQTVTLSASSRLGLTWAFYEGTSVTPNLTKPITGPVALPAGASMTFWAVANASSSSPGSEVVTVKATSSLAPDRPVVVSDAAQINKMTLPPAADFSVSPTTPVAGETVTFTNTTFGTASSWAWDFDDGQTSSSRSPTHVFAEGGRFSVTLTATGSGGASTTKKVVEVVPTRFVFPGVASAAGVNATDWRSEAVFHNPWTAAKSVQLTLTNRGTGAVVASKGITLGAGETRAVADLYAELGAPAGAGALALEGPVLAWVRTSNLLGNGNPLGLPAGTTFGQDAVEIDDASARADRDRFFPIHRPADLARDRRSNLVLHNPGDVELAVTLAAGSGTATATVPPRTYVQVNNVGQFVGAPNGASILRVRANGPWSGSIATVDPFTGDPTTVRGLSRFDDGTALFPGVASAAGQNSTTWRSEAILFNEGDAAVTAKLELLARGSGALVATKELSVGAGELLSIPDVYAQLGAPAGAGALRVSGGVLAWVRIYNQGAAGTFGQDAANVATEYFEPDRPVAFPVRTAADLATEFRSNLVLVNGEPGPLLFTLTIGGVSKTQEVAAGAYFQVNHVGAFVGAPAGTGLLVVSAPGRWGGSVATIDPFSGDPTTVRGIPLP